MKASETKIDRFLATSETIFAIPVYQRNYDWTIKECQQLFNDIIRIANSNDNAHFIGSIVYVHDDDNELYYEGLCVENNSFYPLDEEQSNSGVTEIHYFNNGKWEQL